MKKQFKMPKPVKITGRTSSITNAFVNGIIPCKYPNEVEISDAIKTLNMDINRIECAYCGGQYSQWDHLEPIVKKQRPTGYISEIYNLIPCCSVCNSSKSGTNWRIWMENETPQSPRGRQIKNLEKRIKVIEEYEDWCKDKRTILDFEKIVGKDLWDQHWKNHDDLLDKMQEFQLHSDKVKEKINEKINN